MFPVVGMKWTCRILRRFRFPVRLSGFGTNDATATWNERPAAGSRASLARGATHGSAWRRRIPIIGYCLSTRRGTRLSAWCGGDATQVPRECHEDCCSSERCGPWRRARAQTRHLRARAVTRRAWRVLRRVVLLCVVGTSVAARAGPLPSGPVVRAGSVMVSRPHPGRLDIRQLSARAVVDWHAFDIGRDDVVDIVQPDAGAALLNRVTGATPSRLAGALRADGGVFLVNPNGIQITRSGLVSASDFVASVLDIRDDHFMTAALRHAFTVRLAEDDDMLLLAHLGEHEEMRAARAPGPGGDPRPFTISHAGAILTADAGMVALIGSSIVVDGWIVAPGGQINITAPHAFIAGRVSVDGGPPGTIDIVGTRVHLDDGIVSASGPGGGGRIHVSALSRDAVAPTLTIGATAFVEADGWSAPGTGSVVGGDVHLHSTGLTWMLGNIGARAVRTARREKVPVRDGEHSLGGTVHVAGLAGMHIDGTITVAPPPIAGRDAPVPHLSGIEFSAAGPIVASASDAGSEHAASRIESRALSSMLDTGHVVIHSHPPSSVANDASRASIHVHAPVHWNADTTLLLYAESGVRIDAPITARGERAAVEIWHGRGQAAAVATERIHLPGQGASVTIQGVSRFPARGVRPGDS